ncbi:archaellum component FlaD/FlaE [Halarchaeum solikamskense]|uniref:FlaD/FlaE family flagellar protein n=1 Tax=Halarchaeum nitratireducens TaxID=489913 RepID=UPI001B3B076B|nr:FlaD/FlaE family flagellar protein [Halarchaeum solikamskense]MBP2252415.1 archaellum component FlaD/FlaE [Halarchaeum solikamskense]
MFQRIKHLFGTSDADTEADGEGDADADDPPPFADPPPLDDPAESDARAADGDAAGSPAGSDADDRETLATRVDDLEEDLESTAASLRGVEGAQSDLEDSVDEMHQTVRRLAGVYDRVAAAENPFVDGSLERTPGDTDAPDAVDTAAGTGVDIASDAERDVTADDSVVSFDDLRGDTDNNADDGTADTDAGDRVTSPSFGAPDDPGADAHAGTSRGETRTHDVARGETRARDVDEDEMPVVSSLPGGYAGDVLVMEWLSVLMERSGPAGALRAISHYEAVGWISADVEATLLDIVGGPGLDVFVDPTRPREPSADEHALSYDYLRALRHLREN